MVVRRAARGDGGERRSRAGGVWPGNGGADHVHERDEGLGAAGAAQGDWRHQGALRPRWWWCLSGSATAPGGLHLAPTKRTAACVRAAQLPGACGASEQARRGAGESRDDVPIRGDNTVCGGLCVLACAPQVYEERRKESLALMADTESRKAQIEEVVSARRRTAATTRSLPAPAQVPAEERGMRAAACLPDGALSTARPGTCARVRSGACALRVASPQMATIDEKLAELDAERKELAQYQVSGPAGRRRVCRPSAATPPHPPTLPAGEASAPMGRRRCGGSAFRVPHHACRWGAAQEADRDRRALEFSLLDKQLTKAKAQLEQVRTPRGRCIHGRAKLPHRTGRAGTHRSSQ